MSDKQTMEVHGVAPEDLSAIENFYKAFEGRADLLDLAVVEDWQDIPLAPHQRPGREGMKPLIEGFKAAFPDVKVTIHEVIGAEGRVAVRATITASHAGEWFGVSPTAKPFEMRIHEFHHLANGRLTHTWHLEDWFSWLLQVGAWPVTSGEAR